jgi:hypothetical protein
MPAYFPAEPKRRPGSKPSAPLSVSNSYDSSGTLHTTLPREDIDIGPVPDFSADLNKLSRYLRRRPSAVEQAVALRPASSEVVQERRGPTPNETREKMVPLYTELSKEGGYGVPSLRRGGMNSVTSGWVPASEAATYAAPAASGFVQSSPSVSENAANEAGMNLGLEQLRAMIEKSRKPAPTTVSPYTGILSDPEEERRRQARIAFGYA